MKRSILEQSWAVAKPRHAGAAYNRRARTVALVTLWREEAGSPWDRVSNDKINRNKPRTLDNTCINKNKQGNYTHKFSAITLIMEEVQNPIKNMIRNWKVGKLFRSI